MSKKVPYEVSGSSLVNLKAELYRKQEESRRRNENSSSGPVQQGYVVVKNNSLKSKIKAKSNGALAPAAASQKRASPEDDRSWEKAKVALEAKSKLYDKMSAEQYTPDDGEDEHLLVDFSRKVQSTKYFEQKLAGRYSSDSDSDSDTIGPIPLPHSAEDEWTEYEDYLGRSRRCLRKDLASLTAQNDKLKAEMAHRSSPKSDATDPSVKRSADSPAAPGFDFGQAPLDERTLLSDDMRREMERCLWEEEEQSDATSADGHSTKGKVSVHYQSVENNEIRNLGVSYFKFSKVEEIRSGEMENLNKMHQQTLSQRTLTDQLKAKRKAAMDARLAKVRERKILKGEPVADLKPDDFDEDEFEKALTAKVAPAPFVEDLTPIPKPGSREWDKGKVGSDFEEDKKYVANRREERNLDFAPPAMYPAASAPQPFSKKTRQTAGNGSATQKFGISSAPPYEFNPRQPPPGFPVHQNFPARSADKESVTPESQPWEMMQPWNERMKSQTVEESQHLKPAREKRPFAFAPPPSMYSAESSGAAKMMFARVSEEEIREQARKLFAKSQAKD